MIRIQLFVIILLLSCGGAAAQEDVSKYQKVLVQTIGEDATSVHETVFFYGKNGELIRTIYIWNGGCCQAPVIEEHNRVGDRFKPVRSYTIDEKPDSFARHILCTANLKTTPLEASDQAAAGYSIDEVMSEFEAEETVLFESCNQN